MSEPDVVVRRIDDESVYALEVDGARAARGDRYPTASPTPRQWMAYFKPIITRPKSAVPPV